jgi:hypothetical protein
MPLYLHLQRKALNENPKKFLRAPRSGALKNFLVLLKASIDYGKIDILFELDTPSAKAIDSVKLRMA